MAGLLGGLAALLVATVLQWSGLLPSLGGGPAATMELAGEVEQLRRELEAVRSMPASGDAALGQTVEGLTTGLDQARTDIAALRETIAAGGAGEGAAVEALNRKIAGIEASLAAAGDKATGALEQRLGELEASLATLREGAVTQQDLQSLSARLDQLAGTLASADERIRTESEHLAGLENRIAAIGEKLSVQAAQPRIALTIAGAALKSAVDKGGAFAAEVEAFAVLAPSSPELPELRALAQRGVPGPQELSQEVEGAAEAMIAAAEAPAQDASLWDRLWASARSVVSVRPIGAVEGDSVPARVARMEAAVKANDLPAALAEYDALPEPSRQAGQAFAEKMRERAAAQELVAKALAEALKAVGA